VSHNTFGEAFDIDAIGAQPRRVDIDALMAELKPLGDPPRQYAAVLGLVSCAVLNLMRAHAKCTQRRCDTCWELRNAAAALLALPLDFVSFEKLREAIR
jgi:hypothetical protein